MEPERAESPDRAHEDAGRSRLDCRLPRRFGYEDENRQGKDGPPSGHGEEAEPHPALRGQEDDHAYVDRQ